MTKIAGALAGIAIAVGAAGSATACPCYSLGSNAAGFDSVLGGAWNYMLGFEWIGGSALTAAQKEFDAANGRSGQQLGATGATDVVVGQGGGYYTHYVQDSRETTWNGPGGQKLSQAQLNDLNRSAVKSGAHVSSVNRPTGWLTSGLPNTIGNKITKPDGSSVTYTVNVKSTWDRRLSPIPYDPNNCTTPGC